MKKSKHGHSFKNAILSIILISCNNNTNPLSKNINSIHTDFITDSSGNCHTRTCQDFRKEFDYVVYTGKKIYCYWDLKKAETQNDFEKIASGLKSSITDDTSTYEYYLILRKWAGSLQDGHVNAMWGDANRTELEEYRVPIRLELLSPGTSAEQLIVSKNGPLAKNIPIGAIVTKINDKDAIARINEVEKFVSGSTSRMRRLSAANLIFSLMSSREEEKSPVKIEYNFKGQNHKTEIPRILTLPRDNETNSTDSPVDYESLVQAHILPNNIGYLKIDGFSGEKMFDILDRTMKLLSNTKALIIDLRLNGGGNQSGNAILSWLTKSSITRYHANLKISDIIISNRGGLYLNYEANENDTFTPFNPLLVTPNTKNYQGKVYALTSAYCFSACDTFVSALKENKLATIIGEGTGGGTGSPHVFELPISGLSFRYSVAQGLTAIGKEFIEGKGTLPDVTISPTVDERITGEDQQLIKTVNYVSQELDRPSIDSKTFNSLGINSFNIKGESYSLLDYDRDILNYIH